MVEKAAQDAGATRVTRLDLEVGEVSTVVPDYFRDCYDWAIKKSRYMQDCKLNLVVVAGISYCKDCKKTYRTTAYGKACPLCGGYHTYLVSGRDVMIKDIEVV